MKKIIFNPAFTKMFTLVTLSVILFSFTPMRGLDRYAIYLNKKLVLDIAVTQPLSSRVLQLGKAAEKDNLSINYVHCMNKGAGKSRSIALKDEKGNVLKKWQFADAKSSDLSMSLPLTEVFRVEKTHPNNTLSLYYSSKELTKSEMLSTLSFK